MRDQISPDPVSLGGRTVLRQQWTELAYFHWPYDPATIQPLLPHGVRVDTHDGTAWIGLIPFVMRRVQLGVSPPVPWLGTFIEINVRTYVIDRTGRRAVWFFSLDVPRSAIVAIARSVFALPYCWARADHQVDGARHAYRMERRWPTGSPSADIRFVVGEAIAEPDPLDHFHTARWGLLTARRNRVLHGSVHHGRWPLHQVDEVKIRQDVIEAAGLPSPVGEPRARYSPGVEVAVGWLERVGGEIRR